MMNVNTYIGLWRGIERDYLITIGEMVKEVTETVFPIAFTWEQLCDRRFSTCIQQFNYDPFTGEKIDWKELKNNFNKYAKRTDK